MNICSNLKNKDEHGSKFSWNILYILMKDVSCVQCATRLTLSYELQDVTIFHVLKQGIIFAILKILNPVPQY